jgi:hypothetical protein
VNNNNNEPVDPPGVNNDITGVDENTPGVDETAKPEPDEDNEESAGIPALEDYVDGLKAELDAEIAELDSDYANDQDESDDSDLELDRGLPGNEDCTHG